MYGINHKEEDSFSHKIKFLTVSLSRKIKCFTATLKATCHFLFSSNKHKSI